MMPKHLLMLETYREEHFNVISATFDTILRMQNYLLLLLKRMLMSSSRLSYRKARYNFFKF